MSATRQQAEPQMNATPLIDVLLVLLVMLIFTLPVATQITKLNLPHTTSGAPPPEVRVDVEADGALYWNDERVGSLAELEPRLQALARHDPQPVLKVVAERRAPYEPVAQLLAAAQRAKVRNLSVNPVPDPH
jgi:biopolymer transport protein ExbD